MNLSDMTPEWVTKRITHYAILAPNDECRTIDHDYLRVATVKERWARKEVAAEIGRAVVAQGAKIKKFKQDKDEEYVSQTYAMAMFALGETTIKAFAALEE